MPRRSSRRAASVAVGLMLLLAAIAAPMPAPTTATAADEPQPAPPLSASVTPTPYVALPGYAGPYNIPQGYAVSISDPDPYRATGCAEGNDACLATPRDERPVERPIPLPEPVPAP